MKEYILVILSGILKLVEKTKWPDKSVKDFAEQRVKAFEGGALVENKDIPFLFARSHSIITKDLTLKDGAYPIDPAKWEVVEQWQFKTPYDDEWFECSYAQAQQVKSLKEIGHETRLTATIKPKEHSTGPIIPEGAHVAVMEPTRKLVTDELIEWMGKVKTSLVGEDERATLMFERAFDISIAKIQSEFKAKEIENIGWGFIDGMVGTNPQRTAKGYITQTYQLKP